MSYFVEDQDSASNRPKLTFSYFPIDCAYGEFDFYFVNPSGGLSYLVTLDSLSATFWDLIFLDGHILHAEFVYESFHDVNSVAIQNPYEAVFSVLNRELCSVSTTCIQDTRLDFLERMILTVSYENLENELTEIKSPKQIRVLEDKHDRILIEAESSIFVMELDRTTFLAKVISSWSSDIPISLVLGVFSETCICIDKQRRLCLVNSRVPYKYQVLHYGPIDNAFQFTRDSVTRVFGLILGKFTILQFDSSWSLESSKCVEHINFDGLSHFPNHAVASNNAEICITDILGNYRTVPRPKNLLGLYSDCSTIFNVSKSDAGISFNQLVELEWCASKTFNSDTGAIDLFSSKVTAASYLSAVAGTLFILSAVFIV